jgi:hypothetical protein
MKLTIKSIIIIGMLFALSPVYAFGIGVGVKGGLNFAYLYGEDVEPDGHIRKGFCAGVVFGLDILDLVTIQPEILYTQKGMLYKVDVYDAIDGLYLGTVDDITILDYAEVPVIIKVHIPLQGVVTLNVFAGPYVAYNIVAKQNLETISETDLEDIKSTDYGFVFGAGFDFGLPIGTILVDGRYTLGLTPISESNSEVRNGVISLTLGYLF